MQYAVQNNTIYYNTPYNKIIIHYNTSPYNTVQLQFITIHHHTTQYFSQRGIPEYVKVSMHHHTITSNIQTIHTNHEDFTSPLHLSPPRGSFSFYPSPSRTYPPHSPSYQSKTSDIYVAYKGPESLAH